MKVEVEITRKDIASIEALIAYVDGDDIDPSKAKRIVLSLRDRLEDALQKSDLNASANPWSDWKNKVSNIKTI